MVAFPKEADSVEETFTNGSCPTASRNESQLSEAMLWNNDIVPDPHQLPSPKNFGWKLGDDECLPVMRDDFTTCTRSLLFNWFSVAVRKTDVRKAAQI